MDKDFHRTFTKCPCCGSEDRFFEQLGNELKARELAKRIGTSTWMSSRDL